MRYECLYLFQVVSAPLQYDGCDGAGVDHGGVQFLSGLPGIGDLVLHRSW